MHLIKKIVRSIRLKINPVNYNDIDYLRSRGVKIGENVDILDCSIDFCHGFLISIGNNVTVTGARILAHDASTKKFLGYSKVGRVDIGNDVFIGKGAIILPDTRIGNKVIVGAGCVVANDVPDNVVVAGNPFKIICSFDDYIEQNRKRMKSCPVYNTLWSEKTMEEKERMYTELQDTMGFDL